METQHFWMFIHAVLFAIWFGGLAAGLAMARGLAKPGASVHARLAIRQAAALADMLPRLAFALMMPVGFMLTVGGGYLMLDAIGMAVPWIIAALWILLLIMQARTGDQPSAIPYRFISEVWRGLLGAFFVGAGVYSLLTGTIVPATWVAMKFTAYGLICWVTILGGRLDGALPAALTALNATPGPDQEAHVAQIVDRAAFVTVAVLALLMLAAFMGTAKLT